MSFSVEFQANDGQFETVIFGNEEAARRFASTKKYACVLPADADAPDVAVKQLAPKGKALTLARKASARKARLAGKKPAKSIEGLVKKSTPRPVAAGPSLTDFLVARMAAKKAAEAQAA